ncbi:hypothetical protein [Hydrogenophaga sp.]|uniref:hypothetical protein n=1 Tax=Hydrogenophaga sp. TaxID=1904254 RepID=UPI003F6B53E6
MKIAVIDAGPVGLSAAIMLAHCYEVALHDDTPTTVHTINAGLSPYDDADMAHRLEYHSPGLRSTLYLNDAVDGASLVLVGTPTDYDAIHKVVDTSHLDRMLQRVSALNPQATLAIESTVPVGYTRRTLDRLGPLNLLVAPVLLRPGQVMHDRLNPVRLLVGDTTPRGRAYADFMRRATEHAHSDTHPHPPTPVVLTGSDEAEAIQLFSQKQLQIERPIPLAEVVAYAQRHQLNTEQLSQGLDFELFAPGHARRGHGAAQRPKARLMLAH